MLGDTVHTSTSHVAAKVYCMLDLASTATIHTVVMKEGRVRSRVKRVDSCGGTDTRSYVWP